MPDSVLDTRFSDAELRAIINEALIYQCACPAQVAELLGKMRNLHAYQRNCLESNAVLDEVHQRIARAVEDVHARLETCMDDILTLEGWDRATLAMPETLRRRRDELIENPS